MTHSDFRHEMNKMDSRDAGRRRRNASNYGQTIKNLITLIATGHFGSNEWPAECDGGTGCENYLIDINDGGAENHCPHTVYFGGDYSEAQARDDYFDTALKIARENGADKFPGCNCDLDDNCECSKAHDKATVEEYLADSVSFCERDEAALLDALHSEWKESHHATVAEFCEEYGDGNDGEIVAELLLQFCREYGAKRGRERAKRNRELRKEFSENWGKYCDNDRPTAALSALRYSAGDLLKKCGITIAQKTKTVFVVIVATRAREQRQIAVETGTERLMLWPEQTAQCFYRAHGCTGIQFASESAAADYAQNKWGAAYKWTVEKIEMNDGEKVIIAAANE